MLELSLDPNMVEAVDSYLTNFLFLISSSPGSRRDHLKRPILDPIDLISVPFGYFLGHETFL